MIKTPDVVNLDKSHVSFCGKAFRFRQEIERSLHETKSEISWNREAWVHETKSEFVRSRGERCTKSSRNSSGKGESGRTKPSRNSSRRWRRWRTKPSRNSAKAGERRCTKSNRISPERSPLIGVGEGEARRPPAPRLDKQHKNISVISKENDGDISPCLFLQQPIGYIVNFDSFIAIFWMLSSGDHHFRISISDLKQRRAFSLKCLLPGNVVADLNIDLLAAPLRNKVDLLLIELADINIVSPAKKLDANDVFIRKRPLSKTQNILFFESGYHVKAIRRLSQASSLSRLRTAANVSAQLANRTYAFDTRKKHRASLRISKTTHFGWFAYSMLRCAGRTAVPRPFVRYDGSSCLRLRRCR